MCMEESNSRKLFFNKVVQNVSEEANCDIFICNSKMGRGLDDHFIELIRKKRSKENAFLILVTEGGDPDVAYRIARNFQENYKSFSVCVAGYCKSAGTLLTLGASELVMSDRAELGPLDIQLAKEDALGESLSVLAIPHALKTLQEHAFNCFEESLLEIVRRSRGRVSTKTASKIATELSVGLFSPIFQQFDPLNIGEMTRANSIASHYGTRLVEKYQNVTLESLGFLITQYPSHGFVIDRLEASQLYRNIRQPTEQEIVLIDLLGDVAVQPHTDGAIIRMLNTPVANNDKSPTVETKEQADDGKIKNFGIAKSKSPLKPARRTKARRADKTSDTGPDTGEASIRTEEQPKAS